MCCDTAGCREPAAEEEVQCGAVQWRSRAAQSGTVRRAERRSVQGSRSDGDCSSDSDGAVMYNKEAGESADPQGLEGGLQTEAPHQRRAIFPAPAPTPPAPGPSEAPSPRLNITVAPFTGGPFEVRVARGDTVEDLKKLIARRLKVAKERIYLLYRER